MNREQYGLAYEKGFTRTVLVLRRRGAHAELALETAQAAWARGWERLPQLKDARRVVEWVTSIAVNLLRDHSTRSRRMTGLTSAAGELMTSATVNETVLDLQSALRRCPQRQREALEIYLLSDARSTARIAHDLGTSVGALHHRLSRGRQALRKAMTAARHDS